MVNWHGGAWGGAPKLDGKLRAKIARGRSCASVFFIPRRKMALFKALHGRATMAGVGAAWEAAKGAHQRGGRRGQGGERGVRLGCCSGVVLWGLLGHWELSPAAACCVVREEEEEKEERGKKKKKKKEKHEKISKLEIFGRKIKDNS
jgi:hypothetical protein